MKKMRGLVLLATVVATVVALPAERPEPGQLAFVLSEDAFEDYLDAWLAMEQLRTANTTANANLRSECTFRVNGDLGQPQPVYLVGNNFLRASGNSGQIRVNSGQQIRVSCPGNGQTIRYRNNALGVHTATATCVNNNLISGAGWLQANSAFGWLTCSAHASHEAQAPGGRCFNNKIIIRVGFIVDRVFHTLYQSCFDQIRLEVLYVWYNQDATNAVYQTDVTRPTWKPGSFFPGVNINTVYKQASQKQAIARIVGPSLANRYVTKTQYLARGHLAAKTDFVFATGQRATFYFINVAPQWQPFNAGNWNYLEQNLRARISQAGYNTVIYTGTFGVTQLRDASGRFQDIFLHQTGNTRQVPVPKYFYKVAYDAGRGRGTAFISINNPYYTPAEARKLRFCTDRCRNNNAFNWLRWQPDRIERGYSFCCTFADFKRHIPHFSNIPNFPIIPDLGVNELLT